MTLDLTLDALLAVLRSHHAGKVELPAEDSARRSIPAPLMGETSFLAIDIPTLAFSRGLIQIMLGGLLLYLGGREQGAPGARLWAIGFFFNGLSLLIFPIQMPVDWELPRTVVNHISLGLSSVFLLAVFLLARYALGRALA